MEQTITPTAQKLLASFMQFGRAEWHQPLVAGHKLSEIKVLLCLRRGMQAGANEMRVSDISKLLHVTSPTVTQLLNKLEAHGFVERHSDPADRRAVYLALTARGERVAQRAADTFAITIHDLIAYLGEEQSNQLAELLSKALRYFHERAAGDMHTLWNGEEV